MKCLSCDCEEFELKDICFQPEIKGVKLEVFAKSFVCIKCQAPLMDDEQMNALRKSSADKYRKEHKLLTSEEIIKYRASFKMSQVAFAKYLKVGEASIKRWETYGIQDEGHDDHIRLKCDVDYAKMNMFYILFYLHGSYSHI